jgi:predicted nucleic-acid-binding Zn-ribbon protein
MKICPKCNSSELAQDLLLVIGDSLSGVSVRKQLPYKGTFWTLNPRPGIVGARIKPIVCTDCGFVELIAEPEGSTLKDLLLTEKK